MTIQEKNYILGFLEISDLNKEFKTYEMQFKKCFSDLVSNLTGKEKKRGEEIEKKLEDFIFALKWQYLDIGASASETAREWNLKYIPQIFKKEEVSKNDN